VLTTFFTVRTAPAPDCFDDSLRGVNADVYVGMQGPSEFTMGGTLGNYSTTDRLGEIVVPVLLTSGAYDTMRPDIVQTMKDGLPRAEWFYLRRSAHCSMVDEPGPMNNAVADFLERVEEEEATEKRGHLGSSFVPKSWEPRLDNESVPHTSFWSVAWVLLAFAIGTIVGRRMGGHSRRCEYELV